MDEPTREKLPAKHKRKATQLSTATIALADALDGTPTLSKVVGTSLAFLHFADVLVVRSTEMFGPEGHRESVKTLRDILKAMGDQLTEVEFRTAPSPSAHSN